ncbi:MAG: YIP1 family protein [Candidatus Koribacter versatilis]|uniref:YIP1 family protein n=1 Tax=Candidatus Korobacter versatilis TaxID=658062 RepID=A0A932EQU8_9BACT|nr:YIP1 family protein [Candidatus Koribacter versatilis]
MDSAGTAPTEVSQGPLLSQPQRIINTFFDPVKTFTDLRRGNAWWMAFLFSAIISYVFIFAVASKVGWEQVTENQMKLNPKQAERMEQMPPADRARAMEMGVKFTKYISFAFPVIALLVTAVFAALFMAIFNFGFGAQVGFGTSFAINIYVGLVGSVKALITAITLFAGMDPENFTFDNPIASNLSYFVDVNAHPALHRFAYSMDIFTIWTVVLLGIGYSCVSKVKRGTAIGVVAGLWLLWVLGATALKAF